MRKGLLLLVMLLSALVADAAGIRHADRTDSVESYIRNTAQNADEYLMNQDKLGLPGINIILTEEQSTTAVRIIAKKEIKKNQRIQSAAHTCKVNCNRKTSQQAHKIYFTSLTAHRIYLYGFCQMRC